jgi:adenylate cyclase class IV
VDRELEVRFRIAFPRQVARRVEQAGGILRARYAFTDTVFRRTGQRGAGQPAVLRLREEVRPLRRCRLLLSLAELRGGGLPFRGSALPGGKACLYEGRRGHALRVARALGFQPAFEVRHRSGRVWTLPGGVEVVLERVVARAGQVAVDLGWWVEVAVAAPRTAEARRKLRSAVRRLRLDPRDAVREGLPQVAARALAAARGQGLGQGGEPVPSKLRLQGPA